MNKKQKNIILDEYEEEIIQAFEDGKLKPTKSKIDYQAVAQNTMKKTVK